MIEATKKAVKDLIELIEQSIQSNSQILTNPSYESGTLGLSLFYFYYSRFNRCDKALQKANTYLEDTLVNFNVSNFKKAYSTDSIDNWLSNIGRFLTFGKFNGFFDLDLNDYLKPIDDILFDLMKSKIIIGDFDLTSGALAAGHYFLARLTEEKSAVIPLEHLVRSIETQAFKDEDGDYYWRSPSLYNRIYFGISHGSAMIISFLCDAFERNIEPEICIRILKRAVNFVIKHIRDQPKGLFPLELDDKTEQKQFALCYGDLGTTFAVYKASRILKNKDLDKVVNFALADCLTRKIEDNLTLDAGILYGASGLAATFANLCALTNKAEYGRAADYWYSQIFNYAINVNEFAGFKSRFLNASPIWEISFGWGIIGIGISLMIYCDQALPPISDLIMIS